MAQEGWGRNRLLQIEYSPIAALNRTFALSKVKGNAEAIREAVKLQLNENHYYFTLLGELYREIDPSTAIANFELALSFARSEADRKLLRGKLDVLKSHR